jgi:hypothetical protein
MDRGGTITWYLDANDTDFLATMLRVRNEAKRTGTDVDRDLKRGFGNAKLSLEDFRRTLGRSASMFRNFQIALRGFQMTSLVIGVTLAAGAIIELAGALASLAGLLYTVPAGIGALAGALGTIKLATGGIGDSFKALTKQVGGVSAASNLAKQQSDILRTSMRQDASMVRRLTDLNEQYSETLQELAEERLEVLNAQILKGVTAWSQIASAAGEYLDVSKGIAALTQDVTDAQQALNTAMVTYGPASQQAIAASRDLFAAQGRVASANAQLDNQYGSIKDSVKDLATNLDSLRKANRNEMSASLLNLKALRLDKQARGENIDEITNMVEVLSDLINVKDTKLTMNTDLAGAQADLDAIKAEFPNIAIAATEAATDTEKSLTKSLQNIAESMDDVRRERTELQEDLSRSLADAAASSASSGAAADPFKGLSDNARSFVIALRDVADAFNPIKMLIQDNFFAGLDTEIKNIATTTFPILKTGLGNIASAMNAFLKEVSYVVQQPFFTGAMEASMQTTTNATYILRGAIEPLARAFTDLMNIGNPYVEMLARWIVKQSELAAAFTGSKNGQDKINGSIKTGISALKTIGKFIGEVLGLFMDLFKIADGEGTSLIGTLTEIVQNMREWLAEGKNQEKMKALFEATSTIVKALADTLGGFLKVILNIVEAYNNMEGPGKKIVTDMLVLSAILAPILTYVSGVAASLTALGTAGREAFQLMGAGINAVKAAPEAMAGFKAGLEGIEVANGGAATAFGKLGNGINVAKEAFKAGVSGIADYGRQLAVTAADAIKHAATVAAQGAKAAAGWITQAGKVAAAWAVQFAQMIAKGVLVVTAMVVNAAVAAGAWIAGAVATAAAWVVANAAMLGVWGLIIAAVVGAVALIIANWDSIAGFFKGIWEGIQTGVGNLITWVTENWPLILAVLTGPIGLAVLAIVKNWDTIKAMFSAAWEFIKGIWNGVVGFFGNIGNGIANVFNNAVNGVRNAFNGAIAFVRGVPGSILSAIGNLGYLLWNAGSDMIRGLINGIANNSYAVVNKITEIARGALDAVKKFFGIRSPSRVMAEMGGYVMEGFGNGIDDMAGSVANSAHSAADGVLDAFSSMQGTIGNLQTDFGVNGTSTLTNQFAPAPIQSQLAPAVLDPQGSNAANANAGVTINQTNEVHSELDMDVVNRNLAWELNKI